MKKLGNRLLSVCLAFAIMLSMAPQISVLAGNEDQTVNSEISQPTDFVSTVENNNGDDGICGLSGSGTKEDPYLITCKEELIWFRDHVNTYASDGSNQYKGKYIKLTADIDLENINWEPIGTNAVGDHMAFLGVFDGDGHTISNLYVNANGGHLGFFARVGSYSEGITPTVKNIIFENIDVSANITNHWTADHGDYVGGVIANAGGNTIVSNVKVIGDVYIAGCGYVGGIVGHGYPDMDNCHVLAEEGSYLNCGYWCAGGIIGYAGEGGTPITNCSVSGLEIWTAYGAGGAVAGLLQDGNRLENISVSHVTITSNSDYCMGYIAGNGENSTMTNITMSNVVVSANGEGITSTDATAQIGNKVYATLNAAIDAADDGAVVKLLTDITVTGTIDIAKGKIVTLNLNGYTITGTPTEANAYSVINNKGNLTIIGNGSVVCDYKLTGSTGYAVNTITNSGTLVINGATIENKSTAEKQIGYAIDNNSTTADAIVVIKNGEVKVSGSYYYDGIRLFCNNLTKENSVTVEGGSVSTIWLQNPSDGAAEKDTKDVRGSVVITSGTVNALYLEPSTAFNADISGGYIGKVEYFATADGRDLTGFISGGTFGTPVAEAFCAEGFVPVDNGDDTYGVVAHTCSYESTITIAPTTSSEGQKTYTCSCGDTYTEVMPQLPQAIVNKLGAITFTGDYLIYDMLNGGGLQEGSGGFNMQVVMQFIAKDTAEEAANSYYGDYTTDFYIQINGVVDGNANGCYLAGYYEMFGGWVLIPLDGFTIENGVIYPVITSVGFDFSYEVICESVKDFTCGIYFSEEFLAKNPNVEVSLCMGLSENYEDAVNADFLTVEGYVYDKEDLSATAVAEVNGVKYYSLQAAIDAANGDTVTLLTDIQLENGVVVIAGKNITLDLNGKTVSMNDASGKTASLITNRGTLTINDSVGGGKLSFATTTPGGQTYASNTISNYGTLTINGGIVENTTVGGPACYALDCYAGSTATVNGGKLTATSTTVRVFNWSDKLATLNVAGGEIVAGKGYAINLNTGNTPAVKLNISGGTVTTNDTTYNLAVYAYMTNNDAYSAENVEITVTGGTFNGNVALNGKIAQTIAENKISVSGGTMDGIVCYATPAYGFVSGGTFYAAVDEAYCAEGFIPLDNGDGTYGVKADTYVAEMNGVKYETVQDALLAAFGTNATVLLLQDFSEMMVMVPEGVTLDLNGKILEVLMISSYGDIIDSKNGEGFVKVTKGNAMFSADNAQTPVYNVDGYYFTTFDLSKGLTYEVANGMQFWFKPIADEKTAALLADGAIDNDLVFKVRISWDDPTGGTSHYDIAFQDAHAKDVFTSGNWFFVNLKNYSDFENVTFTVVVSSQSARVNTMGMPVSVQ